MAGYFDLGETKIRPGGYFNVQKADEDSGFGAVDGVVALLFQAQMGPLGVATVIDAKDGYEKVFGTGGTTEVMKEALYGGASKLIAVRVGTGGAAGSVQLDVSDSKHITITSKTVGAAAFKVTVRTKLTDSTLMEVIFYLGTTEIEKYTFAVSADEVDACVAAINNSDNFTAVADTGAAGTITAVAQAAFSGGSDPTVAAAQYSAGLVEVEKYYFNTICVDTVDTTIHALVAAFLDRIYENGQFGQAVLAMNHSTALATREAAAAAFDSEKIIFVLNAYVYNGSVTYDGYQTAAYIAGLAAATAANKSLTHQVLSRYTSLGELLTNSEMETAEQSGCLVLSMSTDDQVWIDSAINTLINLDDTHDKGWKKIRRVKTRFELMYRANAQMEALVGKVDNDTNGRATIVAKLQEVGNTMVREGKLLYVNVTESTTYTADGDSCWFDMEVIDLDSAEHIYMTYHFQYSTVVA